MNLLLRVDPPIQEGPRAGWHEIVSWMHAIELHDEVVCEPARASSLAIAWAEDAARVSAIDWPAERDLAFRALRALEGETGMALPTRMVVRKRIPVGAGLGGGSSDAASALAAINLAHGLGLGAERLRAIGATLGSDVAFFLDDAMVSRGAAARAAIVAGFGDRVERVAAHADEIVLILPDAACPTREVYGAFDRLGARTTRVGLEDVRAIAQRGAIGWHELFNDLSDAACVVSPRVGEVREALAGLPVLVTGSGSAMFGPGALEGDVERIVRGLGGVVVRTRLVG